MQSPAQKIKEAVFAALNGNITYQGRDIPVYSVLPKNVAGMYVYIDEVVETNQDLKDRFMTEGYFQIQVFTSFNTNAGSQGPVLGISNEVCNLLQPMIGGTLDLSPIFNNAYLYRENISAFSEDDQTRKIERRVLRFRFLVEEII